MLNPWIRLGWPANSSETRLMTPGVSMLPIVSNPGHVLRASWHLRLALEILHDVEESVVHIGLLRELDLNLVKIAQRILLEKWNQHLYLQEAAFTSLGFIFSTAVMSYIENGLLALVHTARSRRHGMTRGHTGTEGHRLTGASTSFGL